MRITMDLSEDLLRRANIASAERGCTLDALFAKALERELRQSAPELQSLPELPFLDVRDDCPILQLRPEEPESIDSDGEAEKALEVLRRS